ncbi:MAG: FkbM family methyltransferase [Actinobacteria bacterium]|nr:FkbM family methyltransferase [Actinomycetota bacterium]
MAPDLDRLSGHSVFVSYAQNCEDVILWRALGNIQDGFYIDVGANDPVARSVTRAFYERGWHGINVEPVQYWHDRLMRDRPRDINLRVGASSTDGTMRFYEIEDTGLSTGKLEPKIAAEERGFNVIEIEIEVRTLNDIITCFSPPQIHFLKIDVEGMERDVLQGIDLSCYRPWIIVVEATEPTGGIATAQKTEDQWEDILSGSQYTFSYFDGLNRFYIADEHNELHDAFRYPPSRLIDGYITHYEQELERAKRSAEESLQAERRLREDYEKRFLQIRGQLTNLEVTMKSWLANLQ